jgi:glutamate--cysteine ligase
MLFKSGKDVSIKSAGLQLIDEIATFINELPKEMEIFKEKVMASLDKQKLKFEDSDLTPSGKVVKQLKEKNQSWQELNYDLIKSHKEFYEKQNLNTEYLTKEAISSLQEFKRLQDVKEMPFEKFLEEYLKEI